MREFWQAFSAPAPPPWREALPAALPDGLFLDLPIRDLGRFGIGGLILNQASFAVLRRIVGFVAEAARKLDAEVVVGLPTLGLGLAAPLAEALGHPNYVAAGYSRKRWYEEALSVPISSITSPEPGKRLWLDPRVVHRLHGRRVLLVDDVISTGSSACAGLDLLRRAGVRPVALAVAMVQGDRWRAVWPAGIPVVAAFATPILRPTQEGWVPEPGTAPWDACPLMETMPT